MLYDKIELRYFISVAVQAVISEHFCKNDNTGILSFNPELATFLYYFFSKKLCHIASINSNVNNRAVEFDRFAQL